MIKYKTDPETDRDFPDTSSTESSNEKNFKF